MKNQLFFTLLLLLTSCQTVKWAEKGIYKRHLKYPWIVESICATQYNPVDSVSTVSDFIEGETKFIYDTITINCDSIKNSSTTNKVKVPCPPSKLRVDTFYEKRFVSNTNKVALLLMQKSRDSLKEKYKALEIKASKDYIILKESTNNKIKNKNKHITIISSILGLIAIFFVGKWLIKKYL